jgi:hypothetical protein
MSRAVYVGGFGNGRRSAEGVGGALTPYYEEVDVFTFSEASGDSAKIERATRGVDTYTHSAGLMSLRSGVRPAEVHAFGAPLPTGRAKLLAGTVVKTVAMNVPGVGIHDLSDVTSAIRYGVSSLAEIAVHPVANLRPFINGSISRFDAVTAATESQSAGIPTWLTYMDDDEYFQLSSTQNARKTRRTGA